MENHTISYQEAVAYLCSLQRFGIKFGLSKTSNLLDAFGNPHRGQNYIHIAGTNGKGSVAAFLSSVLREAGLRVGLYSSPHLVRFTERFKVNDAEIPQDTATGLIEELRAAFSPKEPPTFFEATTAMALIYFAREQTDVAIMEVGMGGRLDATNVITPLVSVITNVFHDHQFFLGSRLLDIAGEKAGIIKQGVDVVTGAAQPAVVALLESIAEDRGAPLWRVGKDIHYRTTGSGFHYYGLKRKLSGVQLGLQGRFQSRNAALGIAVVERMDEKGFRIPSRAIHDGLRKASWPGRMHVVAKRPTIMLDGAHNPAAAMALRESIRREFSYRRVVLVVGIMEDKDIAPLLGAIVPLADHVIYTRPVYHRAASPELLAARGEVLGRPGETVSPLTRAIDRARDLACPDDMILVCGSLFTVGEALTYFDPVTYRPDGL